MNKKMIDDLIKWIRDYVKGAKADGVVIGMSGGKDSTIVGKLCTEALGKENVYGLILPNGEMSDIDDAIEACKVIGMKYSIINIADAYNSILDGVKENLENKTLSSVTTINTAPRIRMTMLYAYAGSKNYLVVNTSNLSETMVGYSTKWGDNVGDFAPIANFTKGEVCEIGMMLNLPKHLVVKIPSDGLSGKSDEEKLGFSYAELDEYIRTGKKGKNFDVIDKKHKIADHKIKPIPKFENGITNHFLADQSEENCDVNC